MGFPDGSAGKEATCNVGDLGSIPRLERSTREGNSYPLQYFGLENSVDCIVQGVAELDTTEQLFLHFKLLQQLLLVSQPTLSTTLTCWQGTLISDAGTTSDQGGRVRRPPNPSSRGHRSRGWGAGWGGALFMLPVCLVCDCPTNVGSLPSQACAAAGRG